MKNYDSNVTGKLITYSGKECVDRLKEMQEERAKMMGYGSCPYAETQAPRPPLTKVQKVSIMKHEGNE